MKIFITGATGYVGGHLVNRLIEQGHFLNVLVRSPEKNRHLNWNFISNQHYTLLRLQNGSFGQSFCSLS